MRSIIAYYYISASFIYAHSRGSRCILLTGMHIFLAFLFWSILYTGGTPRTHEHKTVAVELFITYSILSGMGIVFAVICLVFNLVFRTKM